MPPFRIRNNSEVSVTYHQEGMSAMLEVNPQSSATYAWDDLNKEQALVLCTVRTATGGRDRIDFVCDPACFVYAENNFAPMLLVFG